jgi:hypothetical protein
MVETIGRELRAARLVATVTDKTNGIHSVSPTANLSPLLLACPLTVQPEATVERRGANVLDCLGMELPVVRLVMSVIGKMNGTLNVFPAHNPIQLSSPLQLPTILLPRPLQALLLSPLPV